MQFLNILLRGGDAGGVAVGFVFLLFESGGVDGGVRAVIGGGGGEGVGGPEDTGGGNNV